MKVLIRFFVLTLVLFALLFNNSCKKEDLPTKAGSTLDSTIAKEIKRIQDSTKRAQDSIKRIEDSIDMSHNNIIDSVVAKMCLIPTPTVIHPAQEIPGGNSKTEDCVACKTIRYEWAPGDELNFLMDPTSDVIFLGGLIKLETLKTGEYQPVIVQRKPLVFSTSITNINGSPTDTIKNPSQKSSVNEAIQRVLNREVRGSVPAKIVKTVEQIYTKEQASIAANANASGWGAKVSATFNWNNTKVKSRYLIKFYQEYFSLSVNLPSKPSDFVKDHKEVSKLGTCSPVYVSNIKYGRVAMFSLESEQTVDSMGGKVDASFSFAGKSVDVHYELAFKEMMNKSTMKVLVAGGDPTQAASINSPQSFHDFIAGSANFTPTSQPVAIAYTLRFLQNNAVAKVVLATKYDVQSCNPLPLKDPYQIPSVGGGGGDKFRFILPEGAKFSSVAVSSGDEVDRLTINYILNGVPKDTTFGGNGGRSQPGKALNNLKIIGISGRYGDRIDKIRFHYSDGSKSADFGGGGGDHNFSMQANNGGEVIGFYGRSGRVIDNIGIICRDKCE
jgi:hypothetical protein